MKNAKSIGLVLRKMQRVSEINCEIDKKILFLLCFGMIFHNLIGKGLQVSVS